MDIANILLLINGLLCLFMPQHIANLLPYLLGGSMTISGINRIIKWSKQKLEEKQRNSASLANSLLLLILGISFNIQGKSSLVSLGIAWAIIGIIKSVHPLIYFIESFQSGKPIIIYAVEFFAKIALALLLLFDPFGKFTPHLRILGAELIVYCIGIYYGKKRQAQN